MSGANVTIKFDAKKWTRAFEARVAKAQKRLDARVLSDSNYWCPLDTGTLIKSGELNSTLGSGQIQWRTPYAVKQYYGTFDHSKSLKPHATDRWFETAKARYADAWQEVVHEIIRAD